MLGREVCGSSCLNIDIVADAEPAFDVGGGAQGDDLAMRHDADAVSQLISLLDMLGAHNDRPAFFKLPDEGPDLLSGLNIEA